MPDIDAHVAPAGATFTEWRNPVLLPDGRYDCEVLHPIFGWTPYTASADDVEDTGQSLHAAIAAVYVP